MTQKIITTKQAAITAEQLRKAGKIIVLAGGCFDILHVGHIRFLEQAKKQGNYLFVMLESDESVRERKGVRRPINTQKDRAAVLAALHMVNYIIVLPKLSSNKKYDELVFRLKPDIIATTKGDEAKHHKLRQAQRIGAKVVDVTKRLSDVSTTALAKFLGE